MTLDFATHTSLCFKNVNASESVYEPISYSIIYQVFLAFVFEILCFLSHRSQIGKAILSQPACVSKLLSLLLDQRPSPKLVLIILQLCRAALPLMSVEDCENVELPPWSYSVPSLNSEQEDPSDPASKIASLLLAKLADYVVPGKNAHTLLE